MKEKTKLVYKDNEGRFIHVTYETDNQIFNIVSVYAPNNYLEKSKYFKIIKQYIENLENIIIGGDFNTTLSNLDKGSKSKHSSELTLFFLYIHLIPLLLPLVFH
jgi:exonuclease III